MGPLYAEICTSQRRTDCRTQCQYFQKKSHPSTEALIQDVPSGRALIQLAEHGQNSISRTDRLGLFPEF